jgi:hypothetical protein
MKVVSETGDKTVFIRLNLFFLITDDADDFEILNFFVTEVSEVSVFTLFVFVLILHVFLNRERKMQAFLNHRTRCCCSLAR